MNTVSKLVGACTAAPIAALVVAGPLALGLATPASATPAPQSPVCVAYDEEGDCMVYQQDPDYNFPDPTPVCVPSPYGCRGG